MSCYGPVFYCNLLQGFPLDFVNGVIEPVVNSNYKASLPYIGIKMKKLQGTRKPPSLVDHKCSYQHIFFLEIS